MRPLPRKPSPLQAGIALAVIVLCLAALTILYWQIHGILLQVYGLIALFLGLRYCPPVVAWIRSMPVPHRVIFFALLAAVTIGHLRQDARRYFPFVAWDIFAAVSEQETVSCRELIGTTADGKSVRLLVEQLFPSIVQFDLPPTEQPDEMEHLLQALVVSYDRHHASDPLRQVDLMLMAVQLHPSSVELRTEPSCELLHRYEISSGQ